MSDSLGSVTSAAQSLTGIGNIADPDAWVKTLRKASFRGVPFYVEAADGQGGRRVVTHEFPLGDRPYTEDLGKSARHYRLRAYCIGGTYASVRDKLITALEAGTPGTLIHPYLGEKTVMAGLLRWAESKDRGGYVAFDLEFTEQGRQPTPKADTASSVLAGIANMLKLAKQVYAIGSLIASNPSILLGAAKEIFEQAVTDFFDLPPEILDGVESAASLVASLTSGSADNSASATLAGFATAAANVLALTPVPASNNDPVLGTVPNLLTNADLTFGLAALCDWTPTTSLPTGSTLVQNEEAALQQAIIDLVRGSAVLAVATIYAQTDFPTANAANAARTQMQGFIDARVTAAANAGQDDLYRGWRALYALVITDLITRAQNLPILASYATRAPLPSLALSQWLYQTSTRGDELEQLNDVPHPLFMPIAGMALSQ